MKAVTTAVIRALEEQAIVSGVSASELMERAGRGAAEAIAAFAERRPIRRLVIVCGKGNNGGDGRVVARYWKDRPGVVIEAWKAPPVGGEFRAGDLIVDALLGIGASGELRSPVREWVEAINASGCPVASLDIPTGLDADTGDVALSAVRADLTVTFGLPKAGLFRGCGPASAGLIRCVDIGLDAASAPAEFHVYMGRDAAAEFRPLPPDLHKNTAGRVLVVAGSARYPGAGVLAALGAMRSGAGYVTLATESTGACARPAALIVAGLQHHQEAAKYDAVVAGCGWGDDDERNLRLLRLLLRLRGKRILDADALNTIARHPECWEQRADTVVTPHPGEAARLAEAFGVQTNGTRAALAMELAQKLGCVVVLKGHRTLTAAPDGRMVVNGSGSPALATAGTGDVLAGLIGGVAAGKDDLFAAASLAVYWHGRAGELANRTLIADELPALLPQVLDALTPFA